MIKYFCSNCGQQAFNDKFTEKPILKCSCVKQKVWISDDNGGRIKNMYSARPVLKEDLKPKEETVVIFRRTKKKDQ
jgi:hypothetical protein